MMRKENSLSLIASLIALQKNTCATWLWKR